MPVLLPTERHKSQSKYLRGSGGKSLKFNGNVEAQTQCPMPNGKPQNPNPKTKWDIIDVDYATGSFCSSCAIPPRKAGGFWCFKRQKGAALSALPSSLPLPPSYYPSPSLISTLPMDDLRRPVMNAAESKEKPRARRPYLTFLFTFTSSSYRSIHREPRSTQQRTNFRLPLCYRLQS